MAITGDVDLAIDDSCGVCEAAPDVLLAAAVVSVLARAAPALNAWSAMSRHRFLVAASACLAASSTLALVAAPSAQAGIYCEPMTAYAVHSNGANDMAVFDRYAAVNGTGSTITAAFRADSGGTVAATAGIALSAEAKLAVFAKVSATVNASVTKTMTASTGITVTSPVKPYSTLKGDYGIYRERVTMKRYQIYSNCQQSTPTYFGYYAPYRKAWKLYY